MILLSSPGLLLLKKLDSFFTALLNLKIRRFFYKKIYLFPQKRIFILNFLQFIFKLQIFLWKLQHFNFVFFTYLSWFLPYRILHVLQLFLEVFLLQALLGFQRFYLRLLWVKKFDFLCDFLLQFFVLHLL